MQLLYSQTRSFPTTINYTNKCDVHTPCCTNDRWSSVETCTATDAVITAVSACSAVVARTSSSVVGRILVLIGSAVGVVGTVAVVVDGTTGVAGEKRVVVASASVVDCNDFAEV